MFILRNGPYSFKKIEPGSNILYMYLFYSLVYNSVDSHCKEYC